MSDQNEPIKPNLTGAKDTVADTANQANKAVSNVKDTVVEGATSAATDANQTVTDARLKRSQRRPKRLQRWFRNHLLASRPRQQRTALLPTAVAAP